AHPLGQGDASIQRPKEDVFRPGPRVTLRFLILEPFEVESPRGIVLTEEDRVGDAVKVVTGRTGRRDLRFEDRRQTERGEDRDRAVHWIPPGPCRQRIDLRVAGPSYGVAGFRRAGTCVPNRT